MISSIYCVGCGKESPLYRVEWFDKTCYECHHSTKKHINVCGWGCLKRWNEKQEMQQNE